LEKIEEAEIEEELPSPKLLNPTAPRNVVKSARLLTNLDGS